jgi:vacuolar-type H+-ATPase subunit I/STV1
MGKSSRSYYTDDELHKIIKNLPGSNSDHVNDALRRYLVTDTGVLEDMIEDLEKKRKQKRIEKQRIEQDIWSMDDQIEDLKDLQSRAEVIEKVRVKIGMSRVEKIEQIIRENKYDSDPRSATTSEIIDKHVDLIAEDHEDLDREDIRTALDLLISS